VYHLVTIYLILPMCK